MAVDLDLVRHALTVARDGEFASVELEAPSLRFAAELGRAARKPSPVGDEVGETALSQDATDVRSPLVGYFGLASTPVKVGDHLTAGDVIGIVVALGIPNDVPADFNCVVEQILVAEGDRVEYGQPLLKVKPE